MWWGLFKLGLVFFTVQVVLFVMFVKFYSSSEITRFPYTQPSFPDIPVGAVVGANVPQGPRILERAVWVAQPPICPPDPHPVPVKMVVVLHSAGEECSNIPDCAKKIRYIQQYHIESEKWCDTSFNFLIGGDGNVYEGRGWDFKGAHTKGHNNGSLGIAFVGTFMNKLPNAAQVEAFQRLIDVGVSVNKVDRNYTLVAYCQLTVSSDPGWALVNNMTSWRHFDQSRPKQCIEPHTASNKEEL